MHVHMCLTLEEDVRYLFRHCTCRCMGYPPSDSPSCLLGSYDLGISMRICGPLRGPMVTRGAGAVPSRRWPGLVFLTCWALVDGPARMPVGHRVTGSTDQQPRSGMQVRDSSAAGGPVGGVAPRRGATEAPAPACFPIESVCAALTSSGVPRERSSDAGYCARLPALITALASLERKNVMLRDVGAVALPDIEVSPMLPIAGPPATGQTLRARPPSVTAPDSAPVTRVPVVLLPHVRPEPPDTPRTTRRAGRDTSVNQSSRLQRVRSAATIPVSAARQWHDAELAMRVARHSFDRWMTASDQDPRSLASMHAHHTRTAVYEAARAIATLINTLDAEATPVTTTPACDTR